MLWLLKRHTYPRRFDIPGGQYFTDAGIDVYEWRTLNITKGHAVTIIGLLWREEPDSPYVVKVNHLGRTNYVAWLPERPAWARSV